MDLRELLGEELYSQVMEKVGDQHKIAIISDGQWIPKSKFDEVNQKSKTYKEQIDSMTAQLEEMKQSASNNDVLKGQLADLQRQLEESHTRIRNITINTAIEKALLKANAKYPDLLASKFDTSKIVVNENGEVEGIDEQLNALKESYMDMFTTTVVTGADPNAGNLPTSQTKDPFLEGFLDN